MFAAVAVFGHAQTINDEDTGVVFEDTQVVSEDMQAVMRHTGSESTEQLGHH